MQPPPKPPDPAADAVRGLQLLLLAAAAVAYPHELVVRRWGSMGREYPHPLVSLAGLFVVPYLAAALAPPAWGGGLLLLSPALWAGLAAGHTVARWRRRGGGHVHRDYVGDPWLGPPGPRGGEVKLGLLAAGVGFALCPTLGLLLLTSLAASQLQLDALRWRDDRIVGRMKDARWEAEWYAGRMRGEG